MRRPEAPTLRVGCRRAGRDRETGQDFRRSAAKRQGHRCFYCGFPIWEQDAADFAARYGISQAEARRFLCTAEHVLALGDGGTSRKDNIVAACNFCNRIRHRRKGRIAAQQFAALVQRRLAKQAWHPHWLHKLKEAARADP